MKIIGLLLLGFATLFSCTHVSVQSDIKEYNGRCSIHVVDNRPDKKMLSGSIIHSIDITPPIEVILKSKLCNNNRLLTYSARQPVAIEVNDLKFTHTDESIFVITADVKMDGKSYNIHSLGKESWVGLPSTRIERLLNLSLDDFLTKLVSKLQ